MKAKIVRWLAPFLVFAVAISVGAGVSRAQYGGGDLPQTEQTPPAKAAAPVNKKEEDAYKAFYGARGNPATQIQMGEDFIKKYPQSRYQATVYGQLTLAYYNSSQTDKAFEVGNKAIAANPDNVDVLALLAMAISRRVTSSTPDAAEQYQKAEAYARHAIELLPNLPKPEGIDDATFEKTKNDKLSMAHSGLGLIDYQHQKYEDARTELTQAVQLASTPDPVDFYLLGNADLQASYYNDAVTAFGKCAAGGAMVTQCQARLDLAKKDAATKIGR